MVRPTKVVTIGSALQSVYLLNDKGNKASSVGYSVDGGGANAAVTFVRQGFDTSYMGVLGNDLAGRAVLDLFDAEGIDTSGIQYVDKPGTGYSVILVGNNYSKYTYEGASTSFDLLSVNDLIRLQPEWVYITDTFNSTDKLYEVVEACVKLKIKIMLNPGQSVISQTDRIKPLLEDIDVLLVDKSEASALFSGSDLEELVRRAANLVKVVIVTDSVNGSIATDGKSLVRAGLYEDIPVVDRSGAGDSFGAGFLSQWIKDENLKNAVWFASANATAVISSLGSLAGILPLNTKLHQMPIHEGEL